jgi:hypothetical protein
MRRLLAAFATISVVLAAMTYAFWHGRESERARADALQTRIDVLESQRPANPVSRPPQPAAMSVAAAAPAPGTPLDTSNADARSDTADYDDYMALRRRMLRDPKYYEIARASMRPNFATRRAELIRALGVSPAQADAMVDYWIDRQLRSEARELKVATSEEERLEMEKLVTRERREDEERLHAILGDALFPKMQEFIASQPSRSRAYQLRARLADGSEVLRDDQFEPLIGTLHTEQTRLQQEVQDLVATVDPDIGAAAQAQRKMQQQIFDIYKASNRRVHNSAAAILSSKQLAELDAMLRADFEVMQAQNALHQMEADAVEN